VRLWLAGVPNLFVCRDEGWQQVRVTKHGTGCLHYEMTVVSMHRVWQTYRCGNEIIGFAGMYLSWGKVRAKCIMPPVGWGGGVRVCFQGYCKNRSWRSTLYRVSQEECARLRESVRYVKVYRRNPKHLYTKLNGYGDNGQRKVGASCGSKYCNLHSWYATWQC